MPSRGIHSRRFRRPGFHHFPVLYRFSVA